MMTGRDRSTVSDAALSSHTRLCSDPICDIGVTVIYSLKGSEPRHGAMENQVATRPRVA